MNALKISGRRKPFQQGRNGVFTSTSRQVAAILETSCALQSLTDGELAETVRRTALRQVEGRKAGRLDGIQDEHHKMNDCLDKTD